MIGNNKVVKYLLVLYLAFASSCNNGKYNNTIAPSEMFRIENGEISDYQFEYTDCPLLIIKYGKEDCTVCIAERLEEHCGDYFRDFVKKDHVMIILSPEEEQMNLVTYVVAAKKYNFPVFIVRDKSIYQDIDPKYIRKRMLIVGNTGEILFSTNMSNKKRIQKIVDHYLLFDKA